MPRRGAANTWVDPLPSDSGHLSRALPLYFSRLFCRVQDGAGSGLVAPLCTAPSGCHAAALMLALHGFRKGLTRAFRQKPGLSIVALIKLPGRLENPSLGSAPHLRRLSQAGPSVSSVSLKKKIEKGEKKAVNLAYKHHVLVWKAVAEPREIIFPTSLLG